MQPQHSKIEMTRCSCSASHIRWPNTTVRYNLHVLPPSTTKSTFISMYSLMTVSKNSMREHNVPLCTMWVISPPVFSCEVDGFHLQEVCCGLTRSLSLGHVGGSSSRHWLLPTQSKLKFLSSVGILIMFLQLKLRWD